MITLHLSPADVEKVRFAYSPLIEVSGSFMLLHMSNPPAAYQTWIDEARGLFEEMDFPFMRATILAKGYIVDFLTPTPSKTSLSFDEEIVRLRQTPDEVIQRSIETLVSIEGLTPIRQLFLEHPREALECLIDELRAYWQRAIEPHWAQLSSILEGDILFRARALALNGIDAMLTDLSELVAYEQGTIRIDNAPPFPLDDTYQLQGKGIQLVPSIFATCGGWWQVEPGYLPMLIYPTRGLGLWQHTNAPEPNDALALTLGTSRARLLQMLAEPAHTNDLAQRLGLTAGAVSQQLGKLAQAGLIEANRSGSKVYYGLSERGERLLDVFADGRITSAAG
jgi:DNA-binding transcriptional ArsR family regulator